MDITCISDLHGFYPKLEGGDLLIIAGDLTARDESHQYKDFDDWLYDLNYRLKIVIAGNHDNLLMCNDPFLEGILGTTPEYLCDSGIEFEGLKIWGSPWTKTFFGMNPYCKAFTVNTDEELEEKWALIPDDTDILITHTPAWGIHDKMLYYDSGRQEWIDENVGSGSLANWIANHINTLKLHVCGHVHEGYGIHDIREAAAMKNDPTTTVFINASHVNRLYKPVNKPVRIIL